MRRSLSRLSLAVTLVVAGSVGAPLSSAHAADPFGTAHGQLGRFDRDTLRPSGPQIAADVLSRGQLSADGQTLAVGVHAEPDPALPIQTRTWAGLWIIDTATMKLRSQVTSDTPADVVAVPGVVAGLLQNGDLVTVDPQTGVILERRRLGSLACGADRVGGYPGAPAVFPILTRGKPVRLAFVQPNGRIDIIALRQMPFRASEDRRSCGAVGLTTDRQGRRVFVVAGSGRVAEVSLRTRRVRYGRVTLRGAGCSPRATTCSEHYSAAWTMGGLAVAGARTSGRREPRVRLGMAMVDVRTWRTRWRDNDASSVIARDGTVVTMGSTLRGWSATGRRRFTTPLKPLFEPQLVAGRVYVQTRDAVTVLRATTRRVVSRHPSQLVRFWVWGGD